MYHKLIITLIATLCTVAAMAQPQYDRLDTFNNLPHRYYTPEWYSQCPIFNDSTIRYTNSYRQSGGPMTANEYSVDGQIEIKGLMCMVVIDVDYLWEYSSPDAMDYYRSTVLEKMPEYLILLQAGSLYPLTGNLFPRQLTVIDSLRWDTVTPYVLRLPRTANAAADTDYMWCYAYDIYFDTPIVVDSIFYIVGTNHSNVTEHYITDTNDIGIGYDRYTHWPTVYNNIKIPLNDPNYWSIHCDMCATKHNRLFIGQNLNMDSERWYLAWRPDGYSDDQIDQITGPLFAIVDLHTLTLNSSDPEAGTVDGGGEYPHLSTATATAHPAPGHTFVRWNDGVTDNPRQLTMTANKRLVAVFR